MQYSGRIRALQTLLRKQESQTMLVTNLVNILYLTGVDASFGALIVTPRAAFLFLDSRYREAGEQLRGRHLKVLDYDEFVPTMKRVRRCLFEEEHVTVAKVRRWKSLFKSTKFIQTSGLVEGLRRNKDHFEISRMKKALAITDQVLMAVPRMLRPGITEKLLAVKLLHAVIERGGDGMFFDPIVAFGPNTSRPHHHPTDRKLRERDIVQIDMGVRYRHYGSDRSEVFFVGEPTALQRTVYRAVKEANEAAVKAVRAGVTNHELEEAGLNALRKYKLGRYVKGVGHGLGLFVHEQPTLSRRAPEMTLTSGEVVTIEPGVYLDGRFGVRLEDTVFVK